MIKWKILGKSTGGPWVAVRRGQRIEIKTLHCRACAKKEILTMFGGDVSLRGWGKQGLCGWMLKCEVFRLRKES